MISTCFLCFIFLIVQLMKRRRQKTKTKHFTTADFDISLFPKPAEKPEENSASQRPGDVDPVKDITKPSNVSASVRASEDSLLLDDTDDATMMVNITFL